MNTNVGDLPSSDRMPVVFLGHGSPMNAIEDNPFTQRLAALGRELPKPSAILVVSAHWLTPGSTRVLSAGQPRTIHDFWGFPEALYEVRYPAAGAPAFAAATAALLGAVEDASWGFDHASWTVLRHMYPQADVPLYEVSLDMDRSGAEHVAMARALAPLRDHGVLIVGSGNIVHNLATLRWSAHAQPFGWATEFDAWARDRITAGDIDALADPLAQGAAAALAVPTNDHYLPLLWVAALREPGEPVAFPYEGIELGSISMRCVRVG